MSVSFTEFVLATIGTRCADAVKGSFSCFLRRNKIHTLQLASATTLLLLRNLDALPQPLDHQLLAG